MKVAFLIENLDARKGGMERSATEFLTQMDALGIRVQALTQTVAPEFAAAEVQLLPRRGWGRSGRYHQFARQADAFLRQQSWDVVHAVTPCYWCNLYQPRAGVMQEALSRTVAVRRHWLGRSLRRWGALFNSKHQLLCRLERGLFSQSQPPMVAALSQYMGRQLRDSFLLPPERVQVVFNGVTVPLPSAVERQANRLQVREELGLRPNDLVAVFVGHNYRRKGLARFLEALARPEAAAWQLLVLGKDNEAPYLRQARRLQLSHRVRFLGSRPDVHRLYQAADCSVLPSYYDPCARTVLEALSLGVPTITTAFDGASDCITPGVQGYVLSSPEAVEELALALQQLQDAALRERMSEAALALRERLSMRRHAAEIAQIYQAIASNGSFRRG